MPGGPVENVLLVHGYSVRTLNSWGTLPELFKAHGVKPESIYLSAFVSLDDYVSVADLADALESQIANLEAKHALDLSKTALISHSTGALVARRWVLDRRARSGNLPSHLITAAGANHGSTLAQLGRTELAYAFRGLTEKTAVGKRVLEDLDYGSDFARSMNREWLDAWNDAQKPLWKDVWCFSMGGTDYSFWKNQLTWQTREPGSDGTVRISGANLNYRFIDVTPQSDPPLRTITMNQPAAHLVVETPTKRYSHTSQSATDELGLVLSGATAAVGQLFHIGPKAHHVTNVSYGILEGIETAAERPFQALLEAFAVKDEASYIARADSWKAETDSWTAAHSDQANATIVVAIRDATNRLADDSMVLIRDENGIQSMTASLIGQPIKNEVSPSVVSFYVNADTFRDSHPHRIFVEARTDTPYVSYGIRIDAEISNEMEHTLEANECTYIEVHARRDPSAAFAFYRFDDPGLMGVLNVDYPPFPQGNVP
jgi:hypothetical protein